MFLFFYSFFLPLHFMAISSNIAILYDAVELLLSNLEEFLNDNSKLILNLGRKQGVYFSVLVIYYITMLFFFFFYIFT